MVLLHGWGASASTYSALLRASGSGRRLLAPDLPGFGESPIGGGGWTTSKYAELLDGWLGQVAGPRYSLLGHSYGGAVAMRLTAGSSPPDRLLLCAPSGIRPEAERRPGPRVRLFKALRAAGRGLPGRAASSWEAWLTSRFGSADYRAASPELRATLVAAVNEDLTPLARRLAVPTLIVWGAVDPELPLEPNAKRLQELVTGAELVVFEGSGHFPFLDQAARFAAVFDALMDAKV